LIRSARSRAGTLKKAAVVVPLSNRKEFTSEEQISLGHLSKFLWKYDKYFVVPRGLQIDPSGFDLKRFDDKFFGTLKAHTRLMLSPTFYEAFTEYEYILIYHLDSLVFSDQLLAWCELGFDYIGAPWIKDDGVPYVGPANLENEVGNGGFSLRRVKSFLKVLYSSKYSVAPAKFWEEFRASPQLKEIPKEFLKSVLKYLKIFNNVRWEISKNRDYEDVFWNRRGSYYYPEFKIAPFEVAIRFAFECAPRLCFKKNNDTLPFGCHAWSKYDREFWEPYLCR
jgi:hypothetical protein